MSDKVTALKRLYTAITGATCTGNTIVEVIDKLSEYYEQTALITSFKIKIGDVDYVGVIDNENGTIGVTVPYGTVVTSLTPTIVLSSGAKVSPKSGVAKDFTNAQTYTVTSGDGDVKTYTVTVTVETEPVITSFVIGEATGTINDVAGTIVVTVPSGTVVTALEPVIVATEDATVSPASGVATDFTNPQTYTVAKGVSTKTYTVTVTVETE